MAERDQIASCQPFVYQFLLSYRHKTYGQENVDRSEIVNHID